jgi:hypothetical protein
MGLFDKIKKKAEEGLGQVAGQANKAASQVQAEAESENGGMSYEPTEWAYYYRQPDHWGGINGNDIEEFMLRHFMIEEAQGEGNLEQVLAGYGYRNLQEWAHVQCTFYRRHFGRSGQIPADEVEIDMNEPTWYQAMFNARSKQGMMQRQAAAQANPELTAPVEGVTVEQWAAASARIASIGNNPAAQAQVLAQHGMDAAKYQRVNNGFQAKMQGDTTGVIATIFGKAFSEAQGMGGGWGLGTVDGSAQKLGAEPVSFEKYAEINGAMAAWSDQGADVNEKLQAVFGINAAELSKYGAYWSTKMQADVRLMHKLADLQQKYATQYSGPGFDDDLDKI